jgi:hypothetical protein
MLLGFAEREVASNYIPIEVSNVGYKLSVTIYISRLVVLKGEFLPEINFSPSRFLPCHLACHELGD